MSELQVPKHPKLKTLVENYNKLLDTKNQDIAKLFYLQQIMNVLRTIKPSNMITNWQNQLGPSGLEAHLQRYNIHKNASIFLQNIQFAQAVKKYEPGKSASNISLYQAMQNNENLLNNQDSNLMISHAPITRQDLSQYVTNNLAIMNCYINDQKLQEKVKRHGHFLALSYAKSEAIQNFVKQNFPEYQTKILGNPEGNNKNFTLNIDGEVENVVIRVEDRYSLGKESILQIHPVSEYFSEDYVTLLAPFKDEEDEIGFKPLVISEFAKNGDILSYAEKLSEKSPKRVIQEAQKFFQQLNGFCLQLMHSGHYHPDIKLSNFLTDGKRIIVSDRKTITDQKTPTVNKISSSPAYGAPEYTKCIKYDEEGSPELDRFTASKTVLDMPSYMAFQMGMALKEFLIKGLGKSYENYSTWNMLSDSVKNPTNELQNMSVLIQELTRNNPKDRLSIENFNQALEHIHLLPEKFLEKIETLSPLSNLTNQEDLNALKEFLLNKNTQENSKMPEISNNNLKQYVQYANDPRIHLLLKQQNNLTKYLDSVENALFLKDYQKQSRISKFLYQLTGNKNSITRTTTLEELGNNLPKMDEKTQFIMKLASLTNNPEKILGISGKKQKLFQNIMQSIKKNMNTIEQNDHRDEFLNKNNRDTLVQDNDLDKILDNDMGTVVHNDDSDEILDKNDMVTFVQNNDSDEIPDEYNSGTFVQNNDSDEIPDEYNSSTFVQNDESDETPDENDTGTFVPQKKQNSIDLREKIEKTNKPEKNMNPSSRKDLPWFKILNFDDTDDKNNWKPDISDIKSTILRGDKIESTPKNQVQQKTILCQEKCKEMKQKITEQKEKFSSINYPEITEKSFKIK